MTLNMRKLFVLLVLPLIVLSIGAARAEAATVVFDLDTELSVGQSGGAPPWVTLRFDDIAPNQVRFTAIANLQSPAAFIEAIYFNIDPVFYPVLVQDEANPQFLFDNVSGQSALAIETQQTTKVGKKNVIDTGDIFKPGGDGYFDIKFEYDASSVDLFQGTEQSVYDITCSGCTSFGATSFNFVSTEPDGTQMPNTQYYYAAADVQGNDGVYGATNSTVPEPTTLLLLGLGLLLAAGRFLARRFAR
jgi:hypothetical protein